MYSFQYVPRSEYMPIKNMVIEIIHRVQEEVRDDFTFQFSFIGSTKRNMITQDIKSNIGYDFDVNITVNDEDEEYSAEEIRNIVRTAFTKVIRQYGYSKCEDSTRVITIKLVNRRLSRIVHSCDFAIVYGNQYIRYNKETHNYTWEYQAKGYNNLEQKADKLKKSHWAEVRDVYLNKKNYNTNCDKHSRSLYAETINEIYSKYYD